MTKTPTLTFATRSRVAKFNVGPGYHGPGYHTVDGSCKIDLSMAPVCLKLLGKMTSLDRRIAKSYDLTTSFCPRV